MKEYFISCICPFCLKSMQGSWPANIVVSSLCKSNTALHNFTLGVSFCGDMEVKLFVNRRTVFVVSCGRLCPHPLGHGLYVFLSFSVYIGYWFSFCVSGSWCGCSVGEFMCGIVVPPAWCISSGRGGSPPFPPIALLLVTTHTLTSVSRTNWAVLYFCPHKSLNW